MERQGQHPANLHLPSRLAHFEDTIREMQKTRIAYVYALLDPHDSLPRWVGSALHVQDRARQHWRDAKAGYCRGNQQLYEWLCSLSSPPPAQILEEVPMSERWDVEAKWTRKLYSPENSLIFNKRAGRAEWLGDHRPKHF